MDRSEWGLELFALCTVNQGALAGTAAKGSRTFWQEGKALSMRLFLLSRLGYSLHPSFRPALR